MKSQLFRTLSLTAAIGFAATSTHAALVLNLRGDQGVTTGGSGVTSWTDQSSTGNTVSIGTLDGFTNPYVGGTLNGLATVGFTSANSDLIVRNGDVGTPASSGLPGIASDFHGFAVVRPTGSQSTSWGNIISWGPAQGVNNNMVIVGITHDSSGRDAFMHPYFNATAPVEEGTTLALGTAYIIEFYSDGDNVSSATYGININGGSFVTSAYTGLNNAAPVDLGVGHSPGSGLFLDADVAEIVLYNSILTETERQAIGAQLEQRWGVDAAYEPIPEPTSLALLALGGAMIAGRRRYA